MNKINENQLTMFDLEALPKSPRIIHKSNMTIIDDIEPPDENIEQLSLDGIGIVSSRTWIRYFGGKQSAIKEILACFPDGIKEVVSPFVGGGSVEMALAAKGVKVHAFDKFDMLIKCWDTMFENAEAVAKRALELYPLAARCMKCSPTNKLTKPEDIDVDCLKCMIIEGAHYKIEDPIEQAAYCWVANKQDWNGRFLGATGFFDHRPGRTLDKETGEDYYVKRRRIVRRNLNPRFWAKWRNPNITIKCQDWKDTLAQYPNAMLYCDPPYIDNEKSYGENRNKKTHPDYIEFDHNEFAEAMNEHKGGIVLSYVNDKDGIIRKAYEKFEIIPMKWHQGSRASRGINDSDGGKEITIIKPPAVNPLRR